MLKYLIVQLADDSVSFCHYPQGKAGHTIDAQVLRKAIFWAMTENLNIQFVYPDREVSAELKKVIHTIDHADIVGNRCEDEALRTAAAVVTFDGWDGFAEYDFRDGQAYLVRSSVSDLAAHACVLAEALAKVDRVNVALTDIPSINDVALESYRKTLAQLATAVKQQYANGHAVQLNLLTDRMVLSEMNNCNAGNESVTLAPDGHFYICPAFYLDKSHSVGDVETGLKIPNKQLYDLPHAPICRICDAYQCRRCVWLNRCLTLEVNTPGREQCVIAHIERNASRQLLNDIRQIGDFLPETDIPEIDYLDPFEKVKR